MRPWHLCILFIILIYPFRIFAQHDVAEFKVQPSMDFKSITIKDGLSQNWVRCIYQDDQGFIWFGAAGGLNSHLT